jgi:hypothetical protein
VEPQNFGLNVIPGPVKSVKFIGHDIMATDTKRNHVIGFPKKGLIAFVGDQVVRDL